jgi:hypothetical protein
MDVTHVLVDKVKYNLRQPHLGPHMDITATTYNLVCNHRRRILSTTTGRPATWHQKALKKLHEFVKSLYREDTLVDHHYELNEYDNEGNVVTRFYLGAWVLTDNEYHKSSIPVPLYDVRFSEWLESMRKNVECTFGILKGRWRILKTGIMIHCLEDADQIWKTCCALHNMLLEVDGLDDKWQEGVPSHCKGKGGLHEDSDASRFALCYANNPSSARSYDSSGVGRDDDEDSSLEGDGLSTMPLDAFATTGKSFSTLSVNDFRSRLVTHFHIAFKEKEKIWPVPNKKRRTV